jgi:hypothetical protein
MPFLRQGLPASVVSSAASSRSSRLLCGVMLAAMVSGVALPAQASVWAGIFGPEDKSGEQAQQLGPKRLPERNAGDRTSPQALQLEPTQYEAPQGMAAAPAAQYDAPQDMAVAPQYPAYDAAALQPLAQPAPEAASELYPTAPYDAAPYDAGQFQGNVPVGAPQAYDAQAAYAAPQEPFAAPAAQPQYAGASAAPVAEEEKRPGSFFEWIGLSDKTPAHPQQHAAPVPAPAPEAQQAAFAPAAPAPAEGIEYYDADGYPILAATPQNPPAPDHAANQQHLEQLQALNQAGEGTRAAFMARGEEAFAPAALPSATQAPSAYDELALSEAQQAAQYAPQQYAPQQYEPVAPAPAAAYEQPAASYVPPAPEPQQPQFEPQNAPAPALAAVGTSGNVQYDGDLLPPPAANYQPAPAPAFAASPASAPQPYQEPVAQPQYVAQQPAPIAAPANAWGAHAAAPQSQEHMQVVLAPEQAAPQPYYEPAPQPQYVAPQPAPMASIPTLPSVEVPGVDSGDSRVAGAALQPTAYDAVRPVGHAVQATVRYLPESRYANRRLGNARPGLYATN